MYIHPASADTTYIFCGVRIHLFVRSFIQHRKSGTGSRVKSPLQGELTERLHPVMELMDVTGGYISSSLSSDSPSNTEDYEVLSGGSLKNGKGVLKLRNRRTSTVELSVDGHRDGDGVLNGHGKVEVRGENLVYNGDWLNGCMTLRNTTRDEEVNNVETSDRISLKNIDFEFMREIWYLSSSAHQSRSMKKNIEGGDTSSVSVSSNRQTRNTISTHGGKSDGRTKCGFGVDIEEEDIDNSKRMSMPKSAVNYFASPFEGDGPKDLLGFVKLVSVWFFGFLVIYLIFES